MDDQAPVLFSGLSEQTEEAPTSSIEEQQMGVSSPRTRQNLPQPRQHLCSQCSLLDLESLFNSPLESEPSSHGNVRVCIVAGGNVNLPACALCDLLQALVPPDRLGNLDWEVRCCFLSDRNPPGEEWPFPAPHTRHSCKYLGVMPCSFKTSEDDRNRFANNYGVSFFNEYGIIAPSYPGFGHSWDFPIRAIDPIISDWSILTDWIHRCEFDHCPCNATPPAASFQIKLIDCMDKSIVIASTSCKYVALSYVWGYGQTVQSPENGVLPTEIPRTISDAVKATISLGYQYLWCDRYCIDQHNITEKQQQIGSMDCIYRNAHITIIAASGEDDDFGLPGVNHTPRILHPEIFLANARLSCAIPDPIHILSKSKWASRAWTYQEALLSKRRLIFTEQCVYFECQMTRYCEAIHWRPTALRQKHTWYQPYRMKIPTDEIDKWTILDRITEYSKRELTYDFDVLNAFSGIMRLYQSLSPRLHYLCGIPLLYEHEHDSEPKWPARGLMWSFGDPGQRRSNFPSWCWTGWKGTVRFSHTGSTHFPAVKIKAETRHGLVSVRNEEEIQSIERSHDLENTPRYLRISSWCLDLIIVDRPAFILPDANTWNTHYAEFKCKPTGSDNCAYLQVQFLQHDYHHVENMQDMFCIMFSSGELTLTYHYEHDLPMDQGYWQFDYLQKLPVVRLKGETAERVGTIEFMRIYVDDQRLSPSGVGCADTAQKRSLLGAIPSSAPPTQPFEDAVDRDSDSQQSSSTSKSHWYWKEGSDLDLRLQSEYRTIRLG